MGGHGLLASAIRESQDTRICIVLEFRRVYATAQMPSWVIISEKQTVFLYIYALLNFCPPLSSPSLSVYVRMYVGTLRGVPHFKARLRYDPHITPICYEDRMYEIAFNCLISKKRDPSCQRGFCGLCSSVYYTVGWYATDKDYYNGSLSTSYLRSSMGGFVMLVR